MCAAASTFRQAKDVGTHAQVHTQSRKQASKQASKQAPTRAGTHPCLDVTTRVLDRDLLQRDGRTKRLATKVKQSVHAGMTRAKVSELAVVAKYYFFQVVSRHRGRAAHQTCCAMTPLSTSVSGCSGGSDCSGFSSQPQHWWCGVVMRDAIIPDTPWTWPRLTPAPAWCRGRQRLRPHLVEAKECACLCVHVVQ
jgi:hypothetical protein